MSIQELNDLINQAVNPLGGEPKIQGPALNNLLKTLAAEFDTAGEPLDTSKLARLDQANTFAQGQTVTYGDGETGELIGQNTLVYNGLEVDSPRQDLTWRLGVTGDGNFEFATTSGLNAPARPTVMFDTTDLNNPASAVNVQALKTYVASKTGGAGGATIAVEQNLGSRSTTSVPSVAAVQAVAEAKADLANGKVPAGQLPLEPSGNNYPIYINGNGLIDIKYGPTLTFDSDSSFFGVNATTSVEYGGDQQLPTVQAVRTYVQGALAAKADLVNGLVPTSQLPYAGYTPLNIKSAVVNTPTAAWTAGELLDSYYQALPAGTTPGMKFIGSSPAGTAYVYECMNASRGYEGAAMTPVYTWVRWAR